MAPEAQPGGERRILALGGHEFSRREGNEAIVELIVTLAGRSRPRVCLLPTASGDPEEQITSFRRAFAERGCEPSAISLFRLGSEPVDVRAHLLAQDAIYAGGGSLVNLVAIWRAHGLDAILRECWQRGILVCGQSAGAMCWFEHGVTMSPGSPSIAPGLGLLPGSACVHYGSEPERRSFFLEAIASGELAPGFGLGDQAGVLFSGRSLAESYVAREGAAVWRAGGDQDGRAPGRAGEERLRSRRLAPRRRRADAARAEIAELRETLALREASGTSRRLIGRRR